MFGNIIGKHSIVFDTLGDNDEGMDDSHEGNRAVGGTYDGEDNGMFSEKLAIHEPEEYSEYGQTEEHPSNGFYQKESMFFC